MGNAGHGTAAASAPSVGTAAIGSPSAHAKPFAVLTPIRSPVNEPGPIDTARPSSSRGAQRASARTRSTATIRRSECVTLTSRTYSATNRSPSTSATPPASVEVSRASTRIAGSLARGRKALRKPCDNDRREDSNERRARSKEGSRRRRGRGSREDPPGDPQTHRRVSRQRSRAAAVRATYERVHREDARDDGALVHRGTRRSDREALRTVAGRHRLVDGSGRAD